MFILKNEINVSNFISVNEICAAPNMLRPFASAKLGNSGLWYEAKIQCGIDLSDGNDKLNGFLHFWRFDWVFEKWNDIFNNIKSEM